MIKLTKHSRVELQKALEIASSSAPYLNIEHHLQFDIDQRCNAGKMYMRYLLDNVRILGQEQIIKPADSLFLDILSTKRITRFALWYSQTDKSGQN